MALSAELTRRATAYEATRSEIVSSLIEPADEEIATAFDTAGLALDSAVSRRLRFDGAIDLAVSEARALGNDARSFLSREVGNVAERGRETVPGRSQSPRRGRCRRAAGRGRHGRVGAE